MVVVPRVEILCEGIEVNLPVGSFPEELANVRLAVDDLKV
jgi:hypothetical protein